MTWLRKYPFGPLEWRVLEALWAHGQAASVRDLQPRFADIAYTTVMTTLDRLHRKGVLVRTKQGRAFFYTPHHSRVELESSLAAGAMRDAIHRDEAALRPLMSFFVDTVGETDREMLKELESLVRARRAQLEQKAK